MRKVLGWLALVGGGVILGGAVGASAGWHAGTVQLREYPEYLAGEDLSEDVVPRVLYTMIGGFSGALSGYAASSVVGVSLAKRRRRRPIGTAPHEASDARGSIALVEGYLALALIVLPFLAPSVDHPSNDMVIAGAVCAGVAFGLAVGGVRFGKGGGRVAAGVALGVLSLWLLVVLGASIVRWEQVLWYWRH